MYIAAETSRPLSRSNLRDSSRSGSRGIEDRTRVISRGRPRPCLFYVVPRMSSTRRNRGASSRSTLAARLTSPKITRFAFLLCVPSPPRVSICMCNQLGNRHVAMFLTLFRDLVAIPVLLSPFFCTPISAAAIIYCSVSPEISSSILI